MKDTERGGRDTWKRRTWLDGAVNLARPAGSAERSTQCSAALLALYCLTTATLSGVVDYKCRTVSKDSMKKNKNCHFTNQLQEVDSLIDRL